MGDSREIGRREFTTKSALAMLAGTTITITGCESDSPTAPSDPMPPGETADPTPPTVSVTVSSNHGHEAELAVDQLSGGMLTLNIQGLADHPHVVELSMADLQAIAAGTRVSVDSSTDAGHMHSVSFELT